MKKRGLSIRYKILFLLTMIPILTLGAYVTMALRIFEEDKMAYVFDSTSSLSGTLATQIKNQLNSVILGTKPVFQDYLTQRKFSDVSAALFRNDYFLDLISVYEVDEAAQKFQRKEFLEKAVGLMEDTAPILDQLITKSLPVLKASPRFLSSLAKDDRLVLVEKAKSETGNQALYFVMVVRFTELEQMFATSTTQRLFLVNSGGQILFGPPGSKGSNLNTQMTLRFLNKDNKIAQGVEAAKDNSGLEQLLSYSQVGFSDLYVISTVVKDKALGALGVLMRKSLIFFVLLLCLTAMISLLASSSLTQALTKLFDATKKVSEGHFNIRVDVNSSDEVGSLAENFNLMAAEVSRLLDQTAEKARMENELKTAKTVQETLFPETNSRLGPLQISGFYEPASECGGDWWHYGKVGGRIFLWIGDATGHGAPSALITSAAKSAAAIIERLNVTPAKALELLNRCIYEVSKGKLMMTFFIAAFDPEKRELTYANASHEAPFLIKKGSSAPRKKDLIPLNEVNNPRLGEKQNTTYAETSLILDPGDLIFFYTDGIPDIRNGKNEAWGEREFINALVKSNKDYPNAKESVKRFSSSFQEFREGASLIDDVTFFIVKNEGGAEVNS